MTRRTVLIAALIIASVVLAAMSLVVGASDLDFGQTLADWRAGKTALESPTLSVLIVAANMAAAVTPSRPIGRIFFAIRPNTSSDCCTSFGSASSAPYSTRATKQQPNSQKACGTLRSPASHAALRASCSVGVQHIR